MSATLKSLDLDSLTDALAETQTVPSFSKSGGLDMKKLFFSKNNGTSLDVVGPPGETTKGRTSAPVKKSCEVLKMLEAESCPILAEVWITSFLRSFKSDAFEELVGASFMKKFY